MAQDATRGPEGATDGVPLIGRSVFSIAMRYLLRKKLSYLAIVGIMLSVGTLIVVMSVFTGFHDQMVSAIRGYQGDLIVKTSPEQLYGMQNWQVWRELALKAQHVEGVAPFVDGYALVRFAGSDGMEHVGLRGIDPKLEPTVTDLDKCMVVNKLETLGVPRESWMGRTSGPTPTVFVGRHFPGFEPPPDSPEAPLPDRIQDYPVGIILVTATPALERKLAGFAVSGMFRTNHYDYDSQVVLMDLETARSFTGAKRSVSGLTVRVDDFERNGLRAQKAVSEALRPNEAIREFALEGASAPAVSGDGTRAAVLLDGGDVVLFDVGTGDELLRLPASECAPQAIDLDSDGEHVLIGYEDGTVAAIGCESRKDLFRVQLQRSPARAVRFSPDGLLAAAGFENGAVALADSALGEEIATLKGHTGQVNSVGFDRGSSLLITAGQDGTARLWRSDESGEMLRTLTVGKPVACAAFHDVAGLLLTGCYDGEAAVWEIGAAAPVLHWDTGAGGVHVIAPSLAGLRPQGREEDGEQEKRPPSPLENGTILTACAQGVQFWRIQWDEKKGAYVPHLHRGCDGAARNAALSAGGRYVLTTGPDGASLFYAGPDFIVKTWQQQVGVLLDAVAMERFLMALIVSLILVVAEFLIFTIVSTIVAERRRDIGILKAIGFSQRQICKVFLVVGLAVGTLGAALGVAGGLVFADNINAIRAAVKAATGWDPFPPTVYYFKDIPAHTSVLTVLLAAGGAILCSLIFSMLPALRGARMDPVQSLHYE